MFAWVEICAHILSTGILKPICSDKAACYCFLVGGSRLTAMLCLGQLHLSYIVMPIANQELDGWNHFDLAFVYQHIRRVSTGRSPVTQHLVGVNCNRGLESDMAS